MLAWFGIVTFGIALFVLIAASPPHDEREDPLFWFLALMVVLLAALCAVLHNEPQEEERNRFIRVFYMLSWMFAIVIALFALWRKFKAGALR